MPRPSQLNLFFMLRLNDGLSVGCLNLRKLIADNFVQNPVQLFDAVAPRLLFIVVLSALPVTIQVFDYDN